MKCNFSRGLYQCDGDLTLEYGSWSGLPMAVCSKSTLHVAYEGDSHFPKEWLPDDWKGK